MSGIEYGDGLTPYVPAPHSSGWRDAHVSLGAPPRTEPELDKRIPIDEARQHIATLRQDLADAREIGLPASRLLHTLERINSQRASVFETYDRDLPTLAVAGQNFRDAEEALKVANEAPYTIDRAAAVERENELVWRRSVLIVREAELNAARTLASGSYRRLGEAFTLSRPTSPRSLARDHVAKIVQQAMRGDVSPGLVEAETTEEARAWETLFVYRALQAYKPEGDALPLETLKIVFGARADGASARRKWLAEQIKAGKTKTKKREVTP